MAQKNVKSWTDEQLLKCFPKATSYHHLATMLGLKRINRSVQRKIKEYNLDVSNLEKLRKQHYRIDKTNYKIEEVKKLCVESYSYASILRKLGLRDCGGNYGTLKKYIKQFKIDISHFKRESHLAGKTGLTKEKYKTKAGIRNQLLVKRGHKCERCKRTEWEGEQIKIEMHHVDGNNKNNEESNLQLLCPNCHSLTPNFRGRNIAK